MDRLYIHFSFEANSRIIPDIRYAVFFTISAFMGGIRLLSCFLFCLNYKVWPHALWLADPSCMVVSSSKSLDAFTWTTNNPSISRTDL